jgi:hypothetical protein
MLYTGSHEMLTRLTRLHKPVTCERRGFAYYGVFTDGHRGQGVVYACYVVLTCRPGVTLSCYKFIGGSATIFGDLTVKPAWVAHPRRCLYIAFTPQMYKPYILYYFALICTSILIKEFTSHCFLHVFSSYRSLSPTPSRVDHRHKAGYRPRILRLRYLGDNAVRRITCLPLGGKAEQGAVPRARSHWLHAHGRESQVN